MYVYMTVCMYNMHYTIYKDMYVRTSLCMFFYASIAHLCMFVGYLLTCIFTCMYVCLTVISAGIVSGCGPQNILAALGFPDILLCCVVNRFYLLPENLFSHSATL